MPCFERLRLPEGQRPGSRVIACCLLLAFIALSCTTVHRADFPKGPGFIVSRGNLAGQGYSFTSLGLIQVNCRGAKAFLGYFPTGPDFQDCLDKLVEKAKLAGADGVIYLEFDARGPSGLHATLGWAMQEHAIRGEQIKLVKEP